MNLFKSLYTLLKRPTSSTNLIVDTSKKQINTQISIMSDLRKFSIISYVDDYEKVYTIHDIPLNIFKYIYKNLFTRNYIILKFDDSRMIDIYMKNKYEENIEICIEFLNDNRISKISIYHNDNFIMSNQFPNDNSD